MKYFAKLDSDNKVIGFTHVDDSRAPTEQAGIDLLSSDLNHSNWKEYDNIFLKVEENHNVAVLNKN